jgi:hypothetical protein
MLSITAFFVNADPTIDQQEQINQALINARSKVDFNKVKEQQKQQNKDNQLAIKISEITGIPSWRNIVFIRQSRNGNEIDANLLIVSLDQYLIQNNHSELNSTQKKSIIKNLH